MRLKFFIIISILAFLLALPFQTRRTYFLLEDHLFGHLCLKGALIVHRVENLPEAARNLLVVVPHPKSSNSFISKKILRELRALGCQRKHFWEKVVVGQLFISTKFGFSRHVIAQFRGIPELSHRTASEFSAANLYRFGSDEQVKLRSLLPQLSPNYVTVMNRTSDYVKPGEVPSLHSFRNFDFQGLEKALANVSSELQFVRFGAPNGSNSGPVLDARVATTLDPHLDFALQMGSTAYLGADSGPVWLSLLKGVPTAIVNMVPLRQSSPTDAYRLLVVPKLLYSIHKGRLLTLGEMCSSPVSDLRQSEDYDNHGLVLAENDELDISNLLEDWFRILNRDSSHVNEIMEFNAELRSAIGVPDLPPISIAFLARHPGLLAGLGLGK